MHIRRLSTFLLGAWLAGSLFMMLVASHNIAAVDRLMTSPPRQVSLSVELLSEPVARNFFRFQANELNRWYFETWEVAQIVLGAGLIAALVASGRRRSGLALSGLMLLTVVVMRFALTPQLTRLGRLIEFVPLGQRASERALFASFQTGYFALEILKLLLGLILLATLLRRHPSHRSNDGKGTRLAKVE
jgi:hypothetical protein